MHHPLKLIALSLAIVAPSAWASGFALQNQTGSGNGTAFAGAAATAEDAGTIFFNPAGMTYLPAGHNISLSGTALYRVIEFENKGSTTVSPTFFPLPAGDGGDAGGWSLLPHGYWAMGISPNLSVGVGVGPTFGNKTEYDDDFIGRNAGFFFEMKQININPSIAFKVNDQLSLGAGINFAHNESHFKQGVPLVDPAGLTTGGISFPANNYLDVEGDDWAVGYNLGTMIQLSPSTRVGIAYRSELKFELEGEQEYASQNALLRNQDIKATLKTPASLSLALSQMFGDQWEMLADVTWTDWSVVNTLYVKNQDTDAALHKLSYNFKDTWRAGLGANYQYNSAWKLRFGVAYDKSPVRSANDRTMTLPDSDRTWLSVGAKYSLSNKSSVDLGYTHIFFDEVSTNRAVTTGYPGTETTRQTIKGDFDTSVDMVSVQYNHNF